MAESGQRSPHPKLIDRPELKSPFRHLAEGAVTTMLWAVWLYWLLPVVTIFLWAVGVKFFYETLFAGSGFSKLLEVLRNGGIGIIAILTLQLVWVYYNYKIIYKRLGERRKKGHIPSDKVITRMFKIDEAVLKEAREKSRVIVNFENNHLSISA